MSVYIYKVFSRSLNVNFIEIHILIQIVPNITTKHGEIWPFPSVSSIDWKQKLNIYVGCMRFKHMFRFGWEVPIYPFSWPLTSFSICQNKILLVLIINYVNILIIWNKIVGLKTKHVLEVYGIKQNLGLVSYQNFPEEGSCLIGTSIAPLLS